MTTFDFPSAEALQAEMAAAKLHARAAVSKVTKLRALMRVLYPAIKHERVGIISLVEKFIIEHPGCTAKEFSALHPDIKFGSVASAFSNLKKKGRIIRRDGKYWPAQGAA